MKLHFKEPELQWLNTMIRRLMTITKDEAQLRTASRMRYKFAGNPGVVFLNGKERSLVHAVADYRAQSLVTSVDVERDVVNGILTTLEATNGTR